jgi:hypothetical protein
MASLLSAMVTSAEPLAGFQINRMQSDRYGHACQVLCVCQRTDYAGPSVYS